MKSLLFQALLSALNYTEPKLIDHLACTTSGIVRTTQQLKIGPKMELCCVCCSSSELFWFRCAKALCFPSLAHPTAAIPGPHTSSPCRMASRQAFWPSTFWRIRVYDRQIFPGQMHNEGHFIGLHRSPPLLTRHLCRGIQLRCVLSGTCTTSISTFPSPRLSGYCWGSVVLSSRYV
ncbi:hypothetical protein B0H19DRAFT_1185348 [Mycena capillaripes]|nr:hypothetical protein B0H19DRAFT_1185348 [Mycena capillaripes]